MTVNDFPGIWGALRGSNSVEINDIINGDLKKNATNTPTNFMNI